MKIHLDSYKTKATQNNLVLFGDLEFNLGLPCVVAHVGSYAHFYQICTMLKCVHY